MPDDERITFLLDVLDELAGTDFVAHLQSSEVKQQLVVDLARDTGIPGIFCKALFWGVERLLAGMAEHGAEWLNSRFGRPTARVILGIPGSDKAVDWLRRYARRLRNDAELRRYLGRIASGQERASVAALPEGTRADTRLLVRVLEETQLLQVARSTGLAGATTLPPLPRRRMFFIGRDQEKALLMERLVGGGRAAICAVAGMGGVGKTELALQVASTMGKEIFPDGILFVNLRGTPDPTSVLPPLTPEAAMQNVLTQLNPTAKPPETNEALGAAFASVLAGQRSLLILDNAKDEKQLRDLIPPEPVALLVTSRSHIVLPEGITFDLDTLAQDDARSLLKEEIGPAITLDDATLDSFAELCGYLPLALLAIAGTIRRSRSRTPTQLLARLEADRAQGLTEALDRLRPTVEALADDDPDIARRFAHLAVFASDFDAAAAGFIWETDEDATLDTLDALLARSLLLPADTDMAAPSRFRLHDLIRDLAGERLGPAAPAAHLRHATYFLAVLTRCNDLYRTGNDGVLKSLTLFDRERTDIEASQDWLTEHWLTDEAVGRVAAEYSNAGIFVIWLRHGFREQIRWLDVSLAASRHYSLQQCEGNALNLLGVAWAAHGKTRNAIEYYEQALLIYRNIMDRRGEANVIGNLANAWASLEETARSIPLYEEQIILTREIGDRRGEGNAIGNLGLAWARRGENRKAIELYEQHLAIAREIGDRRGESRTLGNIGLAWNLLGENRKAIYLSEQKLAISEELGDRRGECYALGNLGVAWTALNAPKKAIECFERQLAAAREVGERRNEGHALMNAAYAHEALNETEAAMAKAKAAFVIFRSIEHPDVPKSAAWLRQRGVDPDSL